jgi:TPR repeat protein
MYLFGTGVKQDKETAQKWYETGIRLHDPQAQFDFVSHFLMTDQRDIPKATQMLRESAKAGYVPAMYALGHILVNHPALSRSPQEAIPLLELSAGAGTWRASVLLGILARDGRVIPADTRSAYYRFKVATLQGGDDAERLLANDLRILSAKLGAEQTAAADIDAGKWSKEHRSVLQFVYNGGDNRSGQPSFALTLPTDGAHAGQVISSPPM